MALSSYGVTDNELLPQLRLTKGELHRCGLGVRVLESYTAAQMTQNELRSLLTSGCAGCQGLLRDRGGACTSRLLSQRGRAQPVSEHLVQAVHSPGTNCTEATDIWSSYFGDSPSRMHYRCCTRRLDKMYFSTPAQTPLTWLACHF